jgi:hypothetical protein
VLFLLRSHHPFISVQQFRRIGHAHPDNDNRQIGVLSRPTGRLLLKIDLGIVKLGRRSRAVCQDLFRTAHMVNAVASKLQSERSLKNA